MKQESTQKEAAVEQPEVASQETTKETPKVTSPEAKETSERPRTEEEFRKLQGHMTTAINESKRKDGLLQSVQSQLQELQKTQIQQRLETRRRELADLEGDPDGLTKTRQKHQLEDEIADLEEKNEELRGAIWRKYDQAKGLAQQHNLNSDNIFELMDNATTEKEMELMAQLMSTEQAKGKTPPETTGFKPDSNTSDAAPTGDFKQLEKNFIADPYKYGKQYKEALAKRGQ